MGKLRQLSPELWPLIDVILFSYIELIFRGGVSCLPAALLLIQNVELLSIYTDPHRTSSPKGNDAHLRALGSRYYACP